MVLLLRTAAERRTLWRKVASAFVAYDSVLERDVVEEALSAANVALLAKIELLRPFRSWKKGISRAVVKAFENLYSHETCYQ